MTKFVILFSKFVVATLAAVSLTSCNYNLEWGNTITGSQKVVSENRNVGSFDKVTVSRGIDCEVFYSDQPKVTVEADDNLIKEIRTTVENKTLIISCDYDGYSNVASKKVIVHMPKIMSLETSSGASLVSRNTLLSDNLSIKSSSGSFIEAEVEADSIVLETSSGSTQTIRGKALKLSTASSSGSTLNAQQLLANEIFAQSSSGSSTKVTAILLLDAKASSGSSINFTKEPKELRKEESSGGSVSKD